MIKKLFRTRKKEPAKGLAQIYQKGKVKAFAFVDPLTVPTVRRLALFEALNSASLGVSSEDLTAFLDMLDEEGNKGNLARIMQLSGTLRFYLDLHCNLKNLFRIGNTLILLDGEDPYNITPAFTEAKQKLYDENADFRAFFLTRAYLYLRTLSNASGESIDIGAYLKDPATIQAQRQFLAEITAKS